MMLNIAYYRLHALLLAIEIESGKQARCTIACAGGSDEHWQIFDPFDPFTCIFTILPDGTTERHPDGMHYATTIDVEASPFVARDAAH